MRRLSITLGALLLLSKLPVIGQSTVSTTGHDATGNGGSVSVTVGQVGYTVAASGTGTTAAGVQQPLVVIQTDVNENVDDRASVNVFPNPAQDQLTVQVNDAQAETHHVRVIDATGRTIREERLVGTRAEVDMRTFSRGTYTFSVLADGTPIGTFTVIKE